MLRMERFLVATSLRVGAVLMVGMTVPAVGGPISEEPAKEVALSEPAAEAGGGEELGPAELEVEGVSEAPEPTFLATGITCTFHCNDGTGLLYQCPHPTFGQCCSAAGPACASHGGLDSGFCSNGRMGLSCTPFDP